LKSTAIVPEVYFCWRKGTLLVIWIHICTFGIAQARRLSWQILPKGHIPSNAAYKSVKQQEMEVPQNNFLT
jgi:hypothetical protein